MEETVWYMKACLHDVGIGITGGMLENFAWHANEHLSVLLSEYYDDVWDNLLAES
jgi:hypothetical protein